MKNIIAFTAIIALALLASCSHKAATPAVVEKTPTPVAQVAVEQEIQAEVPALTAYNDDMLGQAENTVLFFHSASCGSCRATEKSLLESGTPDDLKVLKINFDEDKDLRKKYSIAKYHTFVQVDANGEAIKTWSGSFTLEDIQEQLVSVDNVVVTETTTDVQVAEVIVETEKPTALAGSYQAYDASLVGTTDNTVLFFHASWCRPCRAADTAINDSGVSDNLTILKIDFDDSAELRKKYAVTSQHTFVQVDAEGNQIAKWSGATTVADIEAQLK